MAFIILIDMVGNEVGQVLLNSVPYALPEEMCQVEFSIRTPRYILITRYHPW
jgi:hypothetical protein